MPVYNNKSTPKRTGGLTGRVSTPRSWESTSLAVKSGLRLEDFIIEADEYEYPVEDRVPPGYYASEIKKLEPRINPKNDKVMLDVSYEICSREGDVYYIKQTYPAGSVPLKAFYRSMVAAGVKPGPNLKDAVGVRETISLGYVTNNSDLGSIVKRWPKLSPKNQITAPEEEDVDEDDDPDFDDFLPDSEED